MKQATKTKSTPNNKIQKTSGQRKYNPFAMGLWALALLVLIAIVLSASLISPGHDGVLATKHVNIFKVTDNGTPIAGWTDLGSSVSGRPLLGPDGSPIPINHHLWQSTKIITYVAGQTDSESYANILSLESIALALLIGAAFATTIIISYKKHRKNITSGTIAEKEIDKKEKVAKVQVDETKKNKKRHRYSIRLLTQLQRIGQSLLFPIAMLPIAAIFLRIGDVVPETTFLSTFIHDLYVGLGNAVFGPALPFLFAIGVGFGMSYDNRGEAAIISFAAMILISTLAASKGGSVFGGYDFVDKIYGNMELNGGHGFHGVFVGNAYNSTLASNSFTGIYVGLIVSALYNKFSTVDLPPLVAFFSRRRLLTIIAIIGVIIASFVYMLVFPWIGAGIFYVGDQMSHARGSRLTDASIMGGYGFINRMLVPFGLHPVINEPLWKTSVGGSFFDATGAPIHGDINIFRDGIPIGNKAGIYQSGFFPAMMFGLPALGAAMWYNAEGDAQKTKVFSIVAASSAVSFFTGITEPLEYTFAFLAPALYLFHALMTGVFAFVVGVFGIQLGFNFSAGLIDYALSVPKSLEIIEENKAGFSAVIANPNWIWLIGAWAGATYFYGANLLIKKFNISSPGRGRNMLRQNEWDSKTIETHKELMAVASMINKALGGKKNIFEYKSTSSRLCYAVKDFNAVDVNALKAAGVYKMFRPTDNDIVLIMGPDADLISGSIRQMNNAVTEEFKLKQKKAEKSTKKIDKKSSKK